ncbi:AAA family ATPase [Roseobacter sp. A03A-229]
MAYGQFEQFIRNMSRVMGAVNTKLQRDLTLRTRVARRFSMVEVASLLAVDTTYLTRISSEEPMFPDGEKHGRERTFSPSEIMLIRAIIGSNPAAKRPYLHWRSEGQPVKVVTFGAQKGGTGKSLSAAHFAQYVNLHYGLRVGVIDADPQATVSLYFADEKLPLFDPETQTLADFMGVDDPAAVALTEPSGADLDKIWQSTPWPGIRLIPGGANIQNGDISLFFMSQQSQVPVYRVLKTAIAVWDSANGPRTAIDDLRGDDGDFDLAAYERALNETVDVIVIDQQPSLTLMQLNGLVAADNVVIPQTMKGFDLATLATYVSNIGEYLEFIMGFEADIEIGAGEHMVLPTIVQEQNTQDTDQILDLYRKAPREVMQVWYSRSDAIANAAEEYKSIYEYMPPKTRRASAKAFMANANAVNDALVQRIWPELPPRDFAKAFIEERWS